MNTALLNIERTQAAQDTGRTMTVIDAWKQASKIRVAAYARVSSDSADQQHSYISQVRYYTQIIRENDAWEYVDIYADEGLTGLSAAKRPDFQRLMADCRAGKIDRVLCKSVSRFSRNFTDCVQSIRELQMLGVSVLFEKENLDTAKKGDELMLALQSLWAQRESVSIAGNMRHGVRMRMRNGTFLPSSAPYGYTLDTENRVLKIHPEQAEVVRRIYAAYLAGRGLQDIADELSRDGGPTRKESKRWHHFTIYYILTNLSYTGDALWQKTYATDTVPFRQVKNNGEKPRFHVQNDHPAIISQEDYRRVQKLLAERREKHAGAAPRRYTLSERVVCGHCGRIHRRKVNSGKVYWVCRNHDHGKIHCPAPQVPEAELSASFARMWNKLRLHRQDIIAPMLEQFRLAAERRYRGNDRIAQVNQELHSLTEQAHVLQRLNSRSSIEPALYLEKSKAVSVKAQELRALKVSLMRQEDAGSTVAAVESLNDALESGPEWLDEMDDELFDRIVDKITVLSTEQVQFHLTCGLVLTENIQKVVR